MKIRTPSIAGASTYTADEVRSGGWYEDYGRLIRHDTEIPENGETACQPCQQCYPWEQVQESSITILCVGRCGITRA